MIDSPCTDICTTDLESDLCIGCGRTTQEIENWVSYTDSEKRQVLVKIKKR